MPGWAERRAYESVISIGAQCLTSNLLKAAGLKRWSGPFDWIFSNLRMVCDCIEDDFATFLDPDLIVPIPLVDRLAPTVQFAHHQAYRQRYGLHAIFNHSDPTRPEVYAYLERCVARFRAALGSGERQLLVSVTTRDFGGRYAFNRLCDLLEDRPEVEVLVLIVREPGEARRLALWEERGRHRLIDLHPTSPIDGIHFADPADTLFLIETFRGLFELPKESERAERLVAQPAPHA